MDLEDDREPDPGRGADRVLLAARQGGRQDGDPEMRQKPRGFLFGERPVGTPPAGRESGAQLGGKG